MMKFDSERVDSMDRTERFYKIGILLSGRRTVPFAVLMRELEVSRATVKRDLEYMRNRMNAPIVWDREARGYRFDGQAENGAQYELPGLWFSSSEIHALLTMQHLLASLDESGLLGPHIQPLITRLNTLMGAAKSEADEINHRIRIIGLAARGMNLGHFEKVASALLRRKRLAIVYYARSRDEINEREVSPQRLVHYRDNWYLDAWCHWRGGLRSFSVDAIRAAEILDKPARNVPEKTLDQVLGSGYGIFSGRKVTWAKLKFTPERARWVASEQWHPRQRSRFDADGSYVLRIPYSDDRELLMDIMKHGPEVEVLGPKPLREKVAQELQRALDGYRQLT